MIKAFLFDYDGVMTRAVPDDTLANRLAQKLGVSPETASAWIAEIWTPLLTGDISEEDAFRLFEAKYGKPISAEQRDVWFKWTDLTPLPIMVDVVRKLKSRGYALGVLSNATSSTKQEISKNGGYDGFDFVIISSEVGYKKPGADIFNLALSKLPGITAQEIVFLDDRQPAIDTASALGLKTILVKDQGKAISEIEHIIQQA